MGISGWLEIRLAAARLGVDIRGLRSRAEYELEPLGLAKWGASRWGRRCLLVSEEFMRRECGSLRGTGKSVRFVKPTGERVTLNEIAKISGRKASSLRAHDAPKHWLRMELAEKVPIGASKVMEWMVDLAVVPFAERARKTYLPPTSLEAGTGIPKSVQIESRNQIHNELAEIVGPEAKVVAGIMARVFSPPTLDDFYAVARGKIIKLQAKDAAKAVLAMGHLQALKEAVDLENEVT